MASLLRYMIESFRLDTWELVTVLPGSRENPNDPDYFTFFFRRDASTDIGL